ncbi:MAG: 2-phopspho-L-lactate transferase, partial [Actinomycetota bacterium]
MTIGVVCGGVGAARFLRAMAGIWPAARTVGVVNTGDDTVMHGLSISPDLDTITYTLAGAIDPERGWGLRDESWRSMEALARFVPVRPDGSSAAATWFNLGDQDLATHFYRTARLAEGATLTEATDEIRRAFGLEQRLVPMTDHRVTTMVSLAEEGIEVPFQEYFVQRRHGVPVDGVRFDGAASASLTGAARAALADSDAVVVAPSNPLVSIGPVRALRGVDALLAARR